MTGYYIYYIYLFLYIKICRELGGVTPPLRLRPPHQRSSGFDLRGTVFLSDAQCLKHYLGPVVARRHYRRLARDIHPDKHPENVEEATRRWLAKWVCEIFGLACLAEQIADWFFDACMHTSCAFCSGFNKLQKHMRCNHLQAALNGILLPAVLRRFVSFVLSRVCCFL